MHKKTKDATDNAWPTSHSIQSNDQSHSSSKNKKSDKDNKWVSTNKN